MKKIALLIPITFIVWLNLQSQTVLLLQEGEKVNFELNETLNSESSHVGNSVSLLVAENVVIDSITIIEKGAQAFGTIVNIEEADFVGMEGSLGFSIDYVVAVNGQHIGLRSVQQLEGKSRTNEVLAAAILLHPLFLVFKGHDVTIEKGTVFSAYVDDNYEIIF